MSVRITSQNGQMSDDLANGTWQNLVNLCHSFDPSIHEWKGTHDGETWTHEECRKMAKQLYSLAEMMDLYELAGGLRID
jgi:hypothetical protein